MGNLQSYPSSNTTYDVFLSFRGEDTRDCFTSHLYEALRRKQIETFIDNQLIRGDEISPALMRAIKGSKISVVIFSEDYASSKWCLRELVEILKCMEMNNQIVLPVFYRVDPSNVRNQTESFKDSFVKHEKELQEKVQEEEQDKVQEEVQTWRKALTKASKLSGWDSSITRTDATLVEEIVNDIWKKLMSEYISLDFGGLIGLERIGQITSLLCLHVTTDVRIIGIWGMGGIGKTMLANAIFNQNSNLFDGVCFIQNVRERLEKCGGLDSVKEEILSKVLKDGNLKLDGLSIPPKIKEKLNCLKVFIVLDDVDDSLKIETLVEGVDGLGQGSRIIITSRDKQVLRNCRVNDDNIYEVKGLNCHEAFQLFCKYAFHENYDIEDPMVNRLVNFTNGNPLALKVLGSSLYKKSKEEWESVVNKFEPTNLRHGVFDVLKISYDGLKDIEKEIFLDIACFLKGKERDYVSTILNGCHYSLSVLIDKSLITISSYGGIEMHDLLEEMGRDIVNKQSSNKIGKRSRLWRQEDVLCTLKNNYGTPRVQGIFLDMFEINKDIHLSPRAFKKMYNLRLLKFYSSRFTYSQVNFSKGLSDLSDELRSLIWYGYPLQALPSNFNPNNLIELDLRGSNLERLWEDCMPAPNLRWLNLSGCKRITKIPELSKSPLLEKIDLRDCRSLLDFPQLAQCVSDLIRLDLRGCNSLRSFPSDIDFGSLTSLDLSNCNNLTKFPQISGVIRILDLSGTAIEELHHSIGNLEFLVELSLGGTAIKELPHSIGNLKFLLELCLGECENLKKLPSSICKMIYLQLLDLSDCSRLEILPKKLGNLKSLKYLSAKRAAIKELPHSIAHLNRLEELFLGGCENLKTLPSGICNLTSLQHLELSGCSRLEILPENLGNLKSLSYLSANTVAIKELPHSIAHLNGLKKLFLRGCKNLEMLPSGIFNLTSLQHLDLSDCSRLEILSKDLGNLKSLTYLSANRTAIKELPHSIAHLNGLVELFLVGCKNLEMLPRRICKLTSLRRLDLSDCSRLEILPENLGNLKSLMYLYANRAAIKVLPHSIVHLNGLEELLLGGCENLKTLPIGICTLTSLQLLDLSDCSRLEMLPKYLWNLKSLKMLSCRGCSGLRFIRFPGLPCSLVYLDLSVNNFDNLPQSTTELWNLKFLHLDNCNKVVSLIDLPINLTHLSACDCKQLQSIPHELDFARILNIKAKPKPTEFIFTNCMNLEETAVGNMLARLMKNLHQEYIRFIFCYPGSEVPKWFRYTTKGSSIKFQKTFDRIVKGFAVCAVIAFEKYLFNGDNQHKLGVHFHCTYSDGDQSSPATTIMSETAYVASRNRNYRTLIDSDHVAFGYCDASYHYWHFGRRFKNYSFEFRLSEESPNCRLKSCGVCPIYYQDSDTDDSDEAGTSGSRFDEEDSDTDDSDEAGTSGSRFDEEEMEPHPKENENLQTVKYEEPIEHIGETSGIRRSHTSNDHL